MVKYDGATSEKAVSDLTILSATLKKPIDFSASADFLEILSGVLYSRVRQLPFN